MELRGKPTVFRKLDRFHDRTPRPVWIDIVRRNLGLRALAWLSLVRIHGGMMEIGGSKSRRTRRDREFTIWIRNDFDQLRIPLLALANVREPPDIGEEPMAIGDRGSLHGPANVEHPTFSIREIFLNISGLLNVTFEVQIARGPL